MYKVFLLRQQWHSVSANRVEKRKTMKALPETGASEHDHGMKDKHIADEIQASEPSTLSKDQKTVMSEHSREMFSVCSIYDVEFGNLAEEHELGARYDMGGKLAFRPYLITT